MTRPSPPDDDGTPGGFAVRPVTPATWADLAALFEAPGGPKYCWCMVWRRTPAEARAAGDRRRQLRGRVERGVPVGLIAYAGGRPAGWVSIAPRETYRSLGGAPARPGETVWALVCFYVPRARRGEGLGVRLLAAAVEHARANGVTAVEAYPVEPDAPSYRFMGFTTMFAAAGFVETGRAGARRRVMRLEL